MLQESDVKSCVDRALDKFGPRLKYTVYLKMGEMIAKAQRKNQGILENPDLLVSSLRAIFGHGASNIEQKIMSEIRQFAGKQFERATDLTSLLQSAKLEDNPRPTLVAVITEM